MKYRPEIDGLRALAVVPVILFHAGFSTFSGGYIGVDIFFVISGYLITTIIIDELKNNNFSIINFYERRARRILPALLFMMIVSTAISWLWLMPNDFKAFSKSLIAVSTFSSNILFWKENDYFDTAAELKPLLHTWSLSVEEQYYIIFPIILIALWKFGIKNIVIFLILLLTASLSLMHWATDKYTTASFYLLPTRFWELLSGGLLAFYINHTNKNLKLHMIDNAASLLGAILILYSILQFNHKTPFPSLYTTIPVIGTLLIINNAKKGTLVQKILGYKLFTGIGLISYSAYLWHQPLLAFMKHRSLNTPSLNQIIIILVLTLILAYFTWKYIEQPFRVKEKFNRNFIFKSSIAGLVLFIITGTTIYQYNGYPSRYPEVEYIFSEASDRSIIDKNIVGDDSNIKIAIIGDSHANSLLNSIDIALTDRKIGALVETQNGCPPITNIYRHDLPIYADSCHLHYKKAYEKIINDENINTIIVSARFPLYINSSRFNNQDGGIESGQTDEVIFDSLEHKNSYGTLSERQEFIENQINFNFQQIIDSGKKLIIIYPIPEMGWNVPDQLAKRIIYNKNPEDISVRLNVINQRNSSSTEILDILASNPEVIAINPEERLCNHENCYGSINLRPIYYDSNHLNNYGATIVVDQIMQFIDSNLLLFSTTP